MIENYFENDRVRVLEKRSKIIQDEIILLRRKILEILQDKYPNDLSQVDRTANSQFTNGFNRWFLQKWKDFELEFQKHWTQKIIPTNLKDDITTTPDQLLILKQSYNEKLNFLETELLDSNKFEEFWIKSKGQISDPTSANIKFRESVFLPFKNNAVDQLTETMVNTLYSIIGEIETMVVQFFGVEEIKNCILPGSHKQLHQEKLRHGLHTLFLRFARPLQYLVLEYAKGTPARSNIIKKYNHELQLLDLFYQGKDHVHLKDYLESGTWNAPSTPKPITNTKKNFLSLLQEEDRSVSEPARLSASFDETFLELKEDASTFIERLRNSVYPAASFEVFCVQELENIRVHILKNEETKQKISEILTEAACKDHPSLTNLIQSSIKNAEHTRRMVVALNNLKN
jgi:hypothetical protein